MKPALVALLLFSSACQSAPNPSPAALPLPSAMPLAKPEPHPSAFAMAMAGPAPGPAPGPSPQLFQTGSTRCSAAQFNSWFRNTIDPCIKKSGELINRNARTYGELWSSYCASDYAEMGCFDTHGSRCLNEQETNYMKVVSVSVMLDRAANNSELLGQDYVNHCPLLRDNQANIQRLKNAAASSRSGK